MHGDGQMAERFMHLLWLGRELREREMRTDAGEPVEIIDPGTLNADGGPDIRGARLRIGGVEFVGEVEMHHRADDWHTHGHGSDPAYNGGILHVALTGAQQVPCATAGLVIPHGWRSHGSLPVSRTRTEMTPIDTVHRMLADGVDDEWRGYS
jgi:hypothetical protein